MVLTKEQKEALKNGISKKRASMIGGRWALPIPYIIDPTLLSNDRARDAIRAAIDDYERETCLTFENKTGSENTIPSNNGRIWFNLNASV